MSLWKKTNNTAGAPKFLITDQNDNRGAAVFGNTTPGAQGTLQVVSLVGVNVATAKAATGAARVTHPGWIKKIYHTGPVKGQNISAAGSLYTNTDTVKVTGGTVNAAGTIVTNGSGGITSINWSNYGKGFSNTSVAVLTITTSTGSGATVAPLLGGRSGRVTQETLVAMTSLA